MEDQLSPLIKSRKFLTPLGILTALLLSCWIIYFFVFAAPNSQAVQLLTFSNLPTINNDQIAIDGRGIGKLKGEGWIKSTFGFKIAFALNGGKEIAPGAYQISKSMNAWQLAGVLSKEPNMKWVVIPEGLRKEQIADLLAEELEWPPAARNTWVKVSSAMKFDELEGVYFPDSYLIPVDNTPAETANRLVSNFHEKFAPYSQEALNQNIQWTTVLKVASLVQREAAGSDDMPLIAGIIWNRLDQDMKLEIDATVQYARDSREAYDYGRNPCETDAITKQSGICYQPNIRQPYSEYTGLSDWWKPIIPEDKNIDSLYNTYKYKGLPPHPIANPGLDAIKAALYPTETECLYYLHDSAGTIHCTRNYAEHQENINKYLQ